MILCLGDPLYIGDSLGPMVGDLLLRQNLNAYIYGTIANPVTIDNIDLIKSFIAFRHPRAKIIVVDAGLDRWDNIGTVKVIKGGLKPRGALERGVKSYGYIGVMGVVGEKNKRPFHELIKPTPEFMWRMSNKTAVAVKNISRSISASLRSPTRRSATLPTRRNCFL